MIMKGMAEGYDYDNRMFQFLHHLRTSTVFPGINRRLFSIKNSFIPGLICLTAFVIERFCATLLLKDYEKKNRWWIGIIIGIGLYIIGGLLAYSLALGSFHKTL
uniref:DUF5658 domain-containing protein n=1 Tax=Caenorhabditis tropicalis TaxID=1561998 RepID=A0A1I7TXC9_9PELO